MSKGETECSYQHGFPKDLKPLLLPLLPGFPFRRAQVLSAFICGFAQSLAIHSAANLSAASTKSFLREPWCSDFIGQRKIELALPLSVYPIQELDEPEVTVQEQSRPVTATEASEAVLLD